MPTCGIVHLNDNYPESIRILEFNYRTSETCKMLMKILLFFLSPQSVLVYTINITWRYDKCIHPLLKFNSHINLTERLQLNPRRGETAKWSRTGTMGGGGQGGRGSDGPKEGWRWRYNSDQGLLKKSRDIMSSPGLLNRHTIICAAPIPTAAFN